jgi:hypothetical protein
MKIEYYNNEITLKLENSKEVKSFKRILLHADHDFRLFPVKPQRMQEDYKFLKEIEEKI